ncbi:unnamed protein product [Cyprideis torosa]|uniref:Uncharacterized protein n=1 Tax=Cyprideis torosa TaxID=163714 RepID=A0A7R8W7C9_9CRUS|nr:unnamed protein product [Cyprideis torosa]CAG0887435.1 unnamed protein product [Cyprideis torosa]
MEEETGIPEEVVSRGKEFFVQRMDEIMDSTEASSLKVISVFEEALLMIFQDLRKWQARGVEAQIQSLKEVTVLPGGNSPVPPRGNAKVDGSSCVVSVSRQSTSEFKFSLAKLSEILQGGSGSCEPDVSSIVVEDSPELELIVTPKQVKGEKRDKKHVCSNCNRAFDWKMQLEAHLCKAKQEKLPCKSCGLLFPPQKLLKHERKHDFVCPHCNRTLSSSTSLQYHMKKKHNSSSDKSTSNGNSTTSATTGRRLGIPCSLCPKILYDSTRLKTHQLIAHEGASLYVCSFCGRNCSSRSYLRKHEDIHRGIKRLVCGYNKCDAAFYAMVDMKRHRTRVHGLDEGIRRYNCPHCTKSYFAKRPLEDHINTHTGGKPHGCPTCGEGFGHVLALYRHRKTTHGWMADSVVSFSSPEFVQRGRERFAENLSQLLSSTVESEVAGALSLSILNLFDESLSTILEDVQKWQDQTSFVKLEIEPEVELESLRDIVVTKRDPSSLPMELSREGLYEEREAKTRWRPRAKTRVPMAKRKPRVATTQRKFICKKCSEEFTHQSHLLNHVCTTEEQEAVAPCKTCGLLFPSRELWRHEKKHDFVCKVCGKLLCSQFSLKEHEDRMHGDGGNDRVVCDTCGESVRRMNLRTHVNQKHDAKASYKCSLCNKVFSNKYETKKHERFAHKGISPHVCTFCGRKCSTASHLRKHENNHQGIKPIACDECGERFALNRDLQRHKSRVHGLEMVRRHQCPQCPKAYIDKKNFKDHMNMHMGLKPYACPSCDSSFAYSGALYTHRKLKHKYGGKQSETIFSLQPPGDAAEEGVVTMLEKLDFSCICCEEAGFPLHLF